MKFLHIISRNKAKEIGIKSYFTGYPCKRGHYSLRSVSNRGCADCAGGFYSDMDISKMFEQQEGICHGCKGSLDILGYHVDHKIPLDKGGSNWPENLQLLCPTCNLKKSNKDYEDWLRTVEKYE